MKIEIYDRATNEVLETKEVENLKGFMTYWSIQCDDKKYGWRTAK